MLTPLEALQQYFGFDQFRPGQEETIQRVLKGRPTLLVMPTGSGKSLAYQLPALLLPGLTLVISPLIALMKDQVDGLVQAGLPATFINSSLSQQEINRRLRAVRAGQVKLLYIAPERLRNRHFTRVLANTKIGLLAVDEAHCISQWGHDFRPDYLQIGPTWQAMGHPTLLATTATATPTVQQDIIKLLGLKQAQTLVTGFNRPNLTLRVSTTPDARTKLQALQGLLRQVEGSAIVYTATRRNTDEVADFVRDVVGLPCGAYHAGLDRDTRYRVQTDFMADKIKVVVATNAFGMGVDKPDVRAVIHYNMPATVEAYYQEAGRAGRDGLPAECVLLFAPDDQRLQEWLINSDTPTYQDLSHLYHLLSQAANEGEVYFAQRELAEITGLHPVTIRVTLSELELAGAIFHLGNESGYGYWKVLPLDKQGLQERAQAINRRAQIRLNLLGKMLDYAYLTTCRRQFLLNYFGDISPPKSPHCCDNHAADRIEDLPKAVTPQEWLPLIVLETARSLQQRPVGRKRLTQLLTGSQAKGMREFGYDRHKFYGKLSGLSQPQVTSLIDALIAAKYLRFSGGDLPVLIPTPAALQALEFRAALPLHIPGLTFEEDTVERWQSRSERSSTTLQTLELFKQDLTPAEIAARRDLTERTIYTHLARLVGEGQVELHRVVPPEIEVQVLEAVETIGSASRLSPIKAALPESISFDHIKCVLAAHPELPSGNMAPAATPNPAERVVALGEAGNLEHIPELISTLKHDSGNVRRLAASALGKIGDPQAVEPLLALLTEETKPQVRQYAIRALGKIGDPRAQPLLERIASDSNEQDYNIKAAKLALENIKKETRLLQVAPSRSIETTDSANLQSPRPPAPQPPGSPAPPPTPDTIILQAVAKLGGTLGRTGLAQFLTGSRAAWLESFAQHSCYGQLAYLSQKATLDIIDALITDGKLLSTGGHRPKVVLAEQKLTSATTEQSIETAPVADPARDDDLSLAPPHPRSPALHLSSPPAPSPPGSPTLLETLRTWRTEQAKTEGMPAYIVFPNKVLEVIAARQPTTLDELSTIAGIGPAKLERYGQVVIDLITGGEKTGKTLPSVKPIKEKSLNQLKIQNSQLKPLSPLETIISVVSDLDGLLTVKGLVQLLTAAPSEVVSFSDHPCFGAFHSSLTPEAVQAHIQQALETNQLALSHQKRLIWPE